MLGNHSRESAHLAECLRQLHHDGTHSAAFAAEAVVLHVPAHLKVVHDHP